MPAGFTCLILAKYLLVLIFFILEFRAVREEHEFFEVCRTPELACEVTMQVYCAIALTPKLNYIMAPL